MTTVAFDRGTIVLTEVAAGTTLPDPFSWDARAQCFRAPARAYAETVLSFRDRGLPLDDRARAYDELPTGALVHREPRPYQTEALAAWRKNLGRGVVVLPTGAGKTHVAMMAIDTRRRDTLVIAPTLDLVRQWYDLLRATFGTEIGIVGGARTRSVRSP